MKTYEVIFKCSEEVADRTPSFYFTKPKDFSFSVGQYVTLYQIESPANAHTFSLASTPQEKEIMITTRMRKSAYKDFLRNLVPGNKVAIRGPGGRFILPKDKTKIIVFLAGGIGITPVRSMLLANIKKELERKIYLFYSNRQPKDAAFLDELKNIDNPNFKLVLTMTELEGTIVAWDGEKGYITMSMIKKHVKESGNILYYTVGSPRFVEGMTTKLRKSNIGNEQIVVDEFYGY